MLTLSLGLFAIALMVVAIAAARGLSRISEILEVVDTTSVDAQPPIDTPT